MENKTAQFLTNEERNNILIEKIENLKNKKISYSFMAKVNFYVSYSLQELFNMIPQFKEKLTKTLGNFEYLIWLRPLKEDIENGYKPNAIYLFLDFEDPRIQEKHVRWYVNDCWKSSFPPRVSSFKDINIIIKEIERELNQYVTPQNPSLYPKNINMFEQSSNFGMDIEKHTNPQLDSIF